MCGGPLISIDRVPSWAAVQLIMEEWALAILVPEGWEEGGVLEELQDNMASILQKHFQTHFLKWKFGNFYTVKLIYI